MNKDSLDNCVHQIVTKVKTLTQLPNPQAHYRLAHSTKFCIVTNDKYVFNMLHAVLPHNKNLVLRYFTNNDTIRGLCIFSGIIHIKNKNDHIMAEQVRLMVKSRGF